MSIQDVKKVYPYRTIGPIANLHITKTIFQKFLSMFVETFKAMSEFFKELTTWKKKPSVDLIKLNRKIKSNVRKNHAPQIKVSLPARVDSAAMKTVAPAAASSVVSGEKKIDEKQVSPWGDFVKEHSTALSIIAGATVLAGGVAYLTYCYTSQTALAPEEIENMCRNWAPPLPDFHKAAEKINVPEILESLKNLPQNPIPNLFETIPTIVKPVYESLKNVTSQCPTANLSAAVPEIVNPISEALTQLKSIPVNVSTQSPLPSLFAAIPKVVKPAFETFTDIKSISLESASLDLSNNLPKILNPLYRAIDPIKSALFNVSPYATNLTVEAISTLKHVDLNPVYQAIGSLNSTVSKVSPCTTNLSLPLKNLPSLTTLTNILSNFLPSYSSIAHSVDPVKWVLFALVTKEGLQFWNQRNVKNGVIHPETVVNESKSTSRKNICSKLSNDPRGINFKSPEKINNDQQIALTSKYIQWLKKQEQENAQNTLSPKKYTDEDLKNDLKKFGKLLFNDVIPAGQKYFQKVGKELKDLNDDMKDTHDYARDQVYEVKESLSATQLAVSSLTDMFHSQFEAISTKIVHQNELLKGYADMLSTVGLQQIIQFSDFTIFNQHINMLCSRVSNDDPLSYVSAKQLLNKYLDDENLPCPDEIITKLASVIEIYKFKTDIKALNFKLDNLHDPILFDERFHNFESAQQFIETNYRELMLLGNSDGGLADNFYELALTVTNFYNKHIANVKVQDEQNSFVEESFLETLDYIVFNEAKAKEEVKQVIDEKLEIEVKQDEWVLFSPVKNTPKHTPKQGAKRNIKITTATPQSNSKGTPQKKANETPKGTPHSPKKGTPLTPKAKLTLTPTRKIESTPEWKSHIDSAKKKLCNELKGKLQPINSELKSNISILKKPTVTPFSPQAHQTIGINSTLNRIINLSKDLVNMGEDESKLNEKNVLIEEMSQYFETNDVTREFKEHFDESLIKLDESLNQLASITKLIKFADAEYGNAIHDNLAAQKEQINEYNSDTPSGKADASLVNAQNRKNIIVEKRKKLKHLQFIETEKFNSIKLSLLSIGKKIGNLIPAKLDDNSVIDLKPIPVEWSTKISKNVNSFNTAVQNKRLETPKAGTSIVSKIENTLSQLFKITEEIVSRNIQEGEVLEKQQMLIEQILAHFPVGCKKSEELLQMFSINQEEIVNSFKELMELKQRIDDCNSEIILAKDDYEKARDSGTESEESMEKKRGDWYDLDTKSTNIRKEYHILKEYIDDYRNLYPKLAEDIANLPQYEEKLKKTPSPVPSPRIVPQENEIKYISSPALIPQTPKTTLTGFFQPTPVSPYLNNSFLKELI